MEQIKGYISQIIYRNNENAYTVFEVQTGEDCFTCVGYLPAVTEAESCIVKGEFSEHPMYGEQLQVAEYQACAPEGREAVFRYLSSGAVRGIGESLARRIVARFGDETMDILDNQPQRLSEVKGISDRKAREIAAQLEAKRDARDAMLFLQQYGISNRQAVKIWDTYGQEIYTILKENPYRLAEDISGIGFTTADEIALRAGVLPDSDSRIRSGILYVLGMALQEGSCGLPAPAVTTRSAKLLGVTEEAVEIQLGNLAIERKVLIRRGSGKDLVFPERVFRQEQQIAVLLTGLQDAPVRDYSEEEIGDRIRLIQEETGVQLDDLQSRAVAMAAGGSVLVISGGPGTGKTTTLNAIIRFFRRDVKTILLAAPTGRAARRMSEATGCEAMTIHRLLECRATQDERRDIPGEEDLSFCFDRDKDHPLDADVIIIDEMSMMDIYLMGALLRAISPGTRLIMVGDRNQLPSVGPGMVLRDIMESGAFPCVVLEKVFRQATTSDIVMNAHRILQSEPLHLDNHSSDFFFLERSGLAAVYKHTVQLLSDMLPRYLHCSMDEIQVLTPMKKGALGTVRLNEVLQSVLNPPKPGKREYPAHDTVFRTGDKVMQTRNNYAIEWEIQGNHGMAIEKGTGIFNGDFGTIVDISEGLQEMTIRFEDRKIVRYPFADLKDLDLAYAITVHKSQGSEYQAVIMPLLSGPSNLFHRNLLYTAITRARSCVVLLGSRQTISLMATNASQNTRYTGLCDRIRELSAARP